MILSRLWPTAVISASLLALSAPAQAEAPGLYYAWRSINSDLANCIDRSTAALNAQELTNIQVEGNSVAGTTEEATAVFVCLENRDSTMVMIMVSSTNDDAAFTLREALKGEF